MSRFPATRAVLMDAIEDRAFPGAAYGVLLRGQIVAMESVGRFTYEPDASPVLPQTIFDIASISKVLATTAMAMLLWERGQMDLDEPIAARLPEFVQNDPPDSPRRTITARMLLAHSSGLPAYERLFEQHRTAQSLLHACLRMPLEAPPDTRTVYSDIGFIILGHLLETIAEESLDHYCRREVFAPLGMVATMYCPPPQLRPSIPPTGIDDILRHRMLQGEVNDDNCYVLGGVSGHAGVFSNVADMLRFADCIVRGAPIFRSPVFRSKTVSLFTSPQTSSCRPSGHADPCGPLRALGWDVPSVPSSSGQFFSAHSVGHLGYTGTSLWIDLEKNLAIVLLTNRTFGGDGPENASKKIQELRPRFHDAVICGLGPDFV